MQMSLLEQALVHGNQQQTATDAADERNDMKPQNGEAFLNTTQSCTVWDSPLMNISLFSFFF